MKYEIVKTDLLTTKLDDFDFTTPPIDPLELAKNLLETVYALRGMGLAANQCGLPYRCFVMPAAPEDFVIFNPRIVNVSEHQVLMDEGCLSYPNVFVKIKRPQAIRLRFAVPSGEVLTKQFAGMTARIIQHEIDHLNGILFFTRANRYHREQAFRQRDKINKKLAARVR